jgi:hypothetical protein
MKTPSRRVRLGAAWLLGLYFTYLYVRMGWGKFDEDGWWTTAFTGWGYPPWLRVLVGAIEVVAWVTAYAVGLAWIACEWWGLRVRRRAQRHDGFIRMSPRAADRQR